jgi:nucleotide-binding universal stress UspA family protein
VFTNILCPVDFSADSERAVAAAVALAHASGGHVTLLTVVDPLLRAGADAAGVHDALDRQTQSELRALLDRIAQTRAMSTVPAVAVKVGEAGREIVAQAREANADVIVMGMRGLGGAQRLLLGSTSAYVLQHARLPVLIVPPAR